MSYTITIDDNGLAALLSQSLKPAIEAGALAVAAAIQDDLAPYPPAPPRRAKGGYYVRGRGQFSAAGKLLKSSEMLNRKWSIKAIPFGARLRNTASYAGWMHSRTKQTKAMAKIGWVREDEAINRVVRGGEARRLMLKAIATALGKR